MKVLEITDNYGTLGGAEKNFFRLINELNKVKDFEIYSMGFSDKNEEDDKHKTIKETKNLLIRHLWRLFFNPIKYFQIRSYIKKVNPDLIHLHNINKYTISLLKAVKGYKVIQTVRDYGLVCPTQWNVHNDLSSCPTGLRLSCITKHRRDWNWVVYLSQLFFFYRRNNLLKKIVKKFITPAPKLKEYLEMSDFKNVTFIPNFISMKDVKPNFDKVKKNQMMYAGLLEENKGVHLLINAMKDIVEKVPSAKLVIAGNGTWEDRLKKQVEKLGLEKNIAFLGWVDNMDKVYEESSVVVVPSIWMENASVTSQEAMIRYRPVVGSNRGGIPWLVENNKTGFVVDILNKEELVSKVLKLLGNSGLIEKFGKAGRKKIEAIANNDKIIKDIKDTYKSLK